MAKILNNPVEHLLSELDRGPHRILVALAGFPGSGKSTVVGHWVAALNRRLGGASAAALSMDGFHLTKAQLKQMPDPQSAFKHRGAPWTFDVTGFAAKVKSLRRARGKPVYWPDFAHEVGDPVSDAIAVAATCRLVFIEGLYTLYRADGWQLLNGCFDQCWYLDTPLETAMSRLLQRHQQAWQISESEARARIDTNDRNNALLVAATRDSADWIIPDRRSAAQARQETTPS